MMDKNREAFEAAYRKFHDCEIRYEKAISGYRYKHEAAAWWAWNAYRQAIEVELPVISEQIIPDDYHSGVISGKESYRGDITEKLTSLGIRVKGNEE